MIPDESACVERLTRRKKGRPGEEIEVLLSDASSFFVAMRVWEEDPFHEGDWLSPSQVHNLCFASGVVAARHRALALLGRSEHSAFLLRRKLISKGMDERVVDSVIATLNEDGSLDDTRYARSWVRDRMRRHPESRTALIAGLRSRGVESKTAETAVDSVFEEEQISVEQVIHEVARKMLAGGRKEPRAVAIALARRGFSAGAVRRVIAGITGNDPLSGDSGGEPGQ